MLALNNGSRDGLEIHPNVWAGVGLVRGGAGTALVGSHEEVADRIEEYAALGIEEFVLSAYPHLEGAYHFGEGVLPVLEKRGPVDQPGPGRRQRVGAVRRPAGRVMNTRVAVVVGNPKPRSRTYESALILADRLGGADLVVDLADHASELFDWACAARHRAGRGGRLQPAWWSSPARPTRRPTPGCSRRSSTASRTRGSAA